MYERRKVGVRQDEVWREKGGKEMEEKYEKAGKYKEREGRYGE